MTLQPNMKWMGDITKMSPVSMSKQWKSVFVEVEPPHEIVNGDVIEVKSEFMGYSDEGVEVWT